MSLFTKKPLPENLDYNKATTWEKLRYSLRSWRYIGVGKSLLIWFLAISIIPLASISFINFLNAYHGLTIVAEKSLNATSQLRKAYLDTFFTEIIEFLETNSKQKADIDLLKTLSAESEKYADPKSFVRSPQWKTLTDYHRDEFKYLANKNGFYDIYYIDQKGIILYSLREEEDLGENIYHGKLQQTRFAESARKALETGKTIFSDLEFYSPSYNKLSGFFVHPVKLENGNIIGLIALQVTMDRINQIIRQEAGYGETGQAYIVGADGLLRTAFRFGDQAEILNKKIDNQKVKDWLFYLTNRNNPGLLRERELDMEKVSTYDSDLNGKYVLGIYRNLDLLEQLGVNWTLIEEIEHTEAFAYARKLSDIVKITFIITIVLVFFTSLLVTRWFVSPIKQLSSWAKQVAVGQLDSKDIKAPNNEIGEMVQTFNRLVQALQKYARVARLMAIGDYSEKVEVRSDEDVLGNSMNTMVESFKQVVDQANRIAKGDFSVNIMPRSDKDTLNIALFEMTRMLSINAEETRTQDWLKTGINLLDAAMSGNNTLQELSSKVLDMITPYVDAHAAAMYAPGKQAGTYVLGAAYGLGENFASQQQLINASHGLAGKAIESRQSCLISSDNNEGLVITTSTGQIAAREVFILPLLHENEVVGLLELATVNQFTGLHKQFLTMAAGNIALGLRTAIANEKVRELLRQTQEQANELAVQQEELRQMNEELQEQTAALRLSEENLQAQQEELRVTNEELEERTQALELQREALKEKNRELEEARTEIEIKARDLEQASRYKSEFLANMSHELRTPLNSILVLSQLLGENKKNHLDAKELEYARTINSSGTDLLELINEILDLSKVEAGRIDLFIENLYIDDVVEYIRKTFSPMAEKKGLELFVNKANNLPSKIRTDPQRVMQVLKNLFSNAIKFTHNGSITLNIYKPDAAKMPNNSYLDPDKTIAFSVCDTGIGIPQDKLELIFEAFRQADGTTSRKYGGTGLGLSISRAFTELLGGVLDVESKEGQGTTFTLYLPSEFHPTQDKVSAESKNPTDKKSARSSKNQDKPDQTSVAKSSQTSDGLFRTDTIEESTDDRNIISEGDRVLLIIEDDPRFASLLSDLAHEHQFKTLVAGDGESGLHFADYFKPSAIILDIGLPGIDGYEVIDRLKKNPRTRHIPVHFVSASDKSLDALRKGAIGYLQKPVDNASLEMAFNRIESVVSGTNRRLLIVEDEEITRKSIVGLMASDDITIEAVDSGEAALELLQNEAFDCLILDLGLKGMSGFELLEHIKKNPKINQLPVVVYTSKDLGKDEDLMLQRYADSIILKGARSFERLLAETTLFLHQVQEKLPEKKQEILRKIHEREDVLNGKTVLIVDDDMRNVFALTSLLDNYGLRTIIAKNGREGLDKLKSNPGIDLVLMDIMMPEMDGYEAMRQIRKDVRYKRLPIIALTAKAMKDDREKVMAAGANEYLTKPFDTEKLLSLLRVWLYK
ncbi:MAG TPA: response regulator [Bacteroidales bacterium]|nr:response regulator [Bacteroidales bacterium]